MQTKNKITISIIVILAILILITQPLNKQVIPSRFVVGEKMGFDLTPGQLNFGQITPGNSGSREMTIQNTFNKPVKISIKSTGEISKHLIVSENNFNLNPLESKNISFTIYTNDQMQFKEYKGKIIITTNKV